MQGGDSGIERQLLDVVGDLGDRLVHHLERSLRRRTVGDLRLVLLVEEDAPKTTQELPLRLDPPGGPRLVLVTRADRRENTVKELTRNCGCCCSAGTRKVKGSADGERLNGCVGCSDNDFQHDQDDNIYQSDGKTTLKKSCQ